MRLAKSIVSLLLWRLTNFIFSLPLDKVRFETIYILYPLTPRVIYTPCLQGRPMASVSQLETVKNLIPSNRSNIRTDCVFCGGKSTLSISRMSGQLLWNCHRASCPAKGREKGFRTLDDMRVSLGKSLQSRQPEFTLPDHLTNVLGNDRAVEYLRRNNCLPAYTKRLADIRYDPQQDRVVFVNRYKNTLVGAVGRALQRETVPKWYRYDENACPYVVGASDIAVIVEDAASACAVSSVATGVALMGTHLSNSYLGMLRDYKSLIVALDPDAQRKGIAMERLLSYYAPTRTALIKNDLKYFTSTEIARMLGIG